jgi:hypothetical protein
VVEHGPTVGLSSSPTAARSSTVSVKGVPVPPASLPMVTASSATGPALVKGKSTSSSAASVAGSRSRAPGGGQEGADASLPQPTDDGDGVGFTY